MIKTRDKYSVGCHPQIAHELREEREVYCRVWDDKNSVFLDWVISYTPVEKYITTTHNYLFAEPVDFVTRVKSELEIMSLLKESGYTVNDKGIWSNPSRGIKFHPGMWKYCGEKYPARYAWCAEWLEELEE